MDKVESCMALLKPNRGLLASSLPLFRPSEKSAWNPVDTQLLWVGWYLALRHHFFIPLPPCFQSQEAQKILLRMDIALPAGLSLCVPSKSCLWSSKQIFNPQ